jgi:hypothetical protein
MKLIITGSKSKWDNQWCDGKIKIINQHRYAINKGSMANITRNNCLINTNKNLLISFDRFLSNNAY